MPRAETNLFEAVRELRDSLVVDGYASGVARIAEARRRQQSGGPITIHGVGLGATLISHVHRLTPIPDSLGFRSAIDKLSDAGAAIAAEIDRLQQLERITAYAPEGQHG